MIKWLSILLAIAGVVLGIATTRTAIRKPVEIPLSRQPSINPFGRGIAALGKIESKGREVEIAAPEPGLVIEVFVDVGQDVKAGDRLFQMDARPRQADLVRAEAAVVAAEAEITRWHALPRKEDIPALEAVVQQYRSQLGDREERLKLTKEARGSNAANDRDVSIDQFAVDEAKASLRKAEADLAKVMSGGWRPDLVIAEALLAQRKAEVEAARLLHDRLTVKAPRDGVILRREIEAGEYASADGGVRAAMVLGNPRELQVRAQVDEEDIGLVGPKGRAVARTRGAVVEQFDLKLVLIEPYARPKMDLTGANTERIDTRVVDVVFAVEKLPGVALYPGQAVDVFVDVEK
ncbi:MAG: biotin/lipoyl-binding protein [Phycisphaerales bacterium]|nr:biotin/lipoyl-binding protein [Phycisphaerales bacterium]